MPHESAPSDFSQGLHSLEVMAAKRGDDPLRNPSALDGAAGWMRFIMTLVRLRVRRELQLQAGSNIRGNQSPPTQEPSRTGCCWAQEHRIVYTSDAPFRCNRLAWDCVSLPDQRGIRA